MLAALILLDGLVPSVRYIYGKTKSPFWIRHYAQQEVAVSRFLKHVVAGQEHPGPPHLEHNEFNRIQEFLMLHMTHSSVRVKPIQSFTYSYTITTMRRCYRFVAELPST